MRGGKLKSQFTNILPYFNKIVVCSLHNTKLMGQQQTHFLSKSIKSRISDQITIADPLINA